MKKLLAMLLTLMMLQMPVLSLAENADHSIGVIGGADGPTALLVTGDCGGMATLSEAALAAGRRINTVLSIKELKGAQSGDPMVDAAIADLLATLGIRVSQQGDEGELALQISGQDVMNLGAAVNGKDVYLSSNLLGGTIVVNVEEIEPVIGRFLDMFVLMEAMTAAEAAEIKEILAAASDEMEASMGAATESVGAMHDLENLNFTALEKAFTIVTENMEYVETPVLPKMCDAAENGVRLSISNEEFVEILRACLDFVNDNPALKEHLATTGDFYTEEEIKEMWAWYKNAGLNESEEEFRARHQTFEQAFNDAYESLNGAKLLNGEFTIALYMNEESEPVYGVMNLPMAEGDQTSTLEIVYTRQTVAAGVAHVCNITVDGQTATIDGLVTDESTVINVFAAGGEKAMDIIITNVAEDAKTAELNAYNGDATLFSALLEGEWEFTDMRHYLAGKLTMTNYDGVPNGENMVFAVNSDYAINGVDFSGATNFSFDFEGAGMTVQVISETAEAVESMMAGSVIRPAELDDTAFQTWFVGLINGLNIALTTALTALPESVLMLMFSTGMM